MNTIERQQEILSEICQIVFAVADDEYDELRLEVDVHANELLCRSTFSQTVNGVSESLPMPPEEESPTLLELSLQLHKEMMSHTGGDMKKYILRISSEGRATADFEYNEPPAEVGGPNAS